ncbi:MAG: hypothetical protein ACP5OZ_03565 [Candidatus Woesearchaeota archaeon]
MQKSMREIVNELSYEDLLKFKKDLEENSFQIKKLVEQRIRQEIEKNSHVCANCGRKMNPYEDDELCLIFGPPDFKRRAYFCGIDCLEYFLAELKKIEVKKLKIPKI